MKVIRPGNQFLPAWSRRCGIIASKRCGMSKPGGKANRRRTRFHPKHTGECLRLLIMRLLAIFLITLCWGDSASLLSSFTMIEGFIWDLPFLYTLAYQMKACALAEKRGVPGIARTGSCHVIWWGKANYLGFDQTWSLWLFHLSSYGFCRHKKAIWKLKRHGVRRRYITSHPTYAHCESKHFSSRSTSNCPYSR
jgi:hypothetical protein